MLKTLKRLQPLITIENSTLTLEELSTQYKVTLDPCLFACAFSKTYKLALSTAQKYYGISEEDLVSYMSVTLDFCLLNFEKNNASFLTYFNLILANKLREETEALTTQKRKANLFPQSYEKLVEDGFDIADSTDSQIWMTVETLKSFKLDTKELKYCELIMTGYTNSDIAKILKVSVMTLSNMRKNLRQKIDVLAL